MLVGKAVDGGELAVGRRGGGALFRLDPKIVDRQIACHITRTTLAAHGIIQADLSRSPMRTGAISGPGPRYCPSIEDKVTRFGDRDGHQIFLEPEGLDNSTVYPNGVSTSLPEATQQAFINAIPGLEEARICGPAMRSNMIMSIRANWTPRCKRSVSRGLFFAGQINGTTGYEEAAAQGLVAGPQRHRLRGGEPGHSVRSGRGLSAIR